MDPVDWKKIEGNWVELVDNLRVGDALPYLIQNEVIHSSEQERIEFLPSQKERTETLLRTLKHKHGSYKFLYNALEKDYRFLKEKLPAPEENVTDDPVGCLQSVYVQHSGSKVSFADIRRVLKEGTGKEYNIPVMTRLVKQSFEYVDFEIKKEKKKSTDRLQKQFVKHIKRKGPSKEPATDRKSTPFNCDSQATHTSADNLQSLSVGSLFEKLSPWAEQQGINKAFLDVLTDESIDGYVLCAMTDEEMKKFFPSMPFGHRKKLQLHLSQSNPGKRTNQTSTEKEGKAQEEILEFDKAMKPTSSYKHQAIIRGKETRVTNMIDPIHRFLSSEILGNDNVVSEIAEETVKFAAACLNSRTNGTIHFGISADQNEELSVEGLSADKTECQKEIDKVKRNRFFPDQLEIVSACIRPARFVEVIQAQPGPRLYVVEVDVVPNSSVVKENAFFLQPTRAGRRSHLNVNLCKFKEGQIYDLSGDEVRQYMGMKQDLSEARKREEEKYVIRLKNKHVPDLAKKFTQLFCGGGNTFDGDLYPVLICGKPDRKSRDQINGRNFDFLKRIDWQIVLDVDDCAAKPNIYSLYEYQQAKTTNTLLVDDFDPKETKNVENKGNLEVILDGLFSSRHPSWVFVNGYSPLHSVAVSPAEWKRKRAIGFKELLRFYHTKIPENRTVIVVLILSKDQDVLVDILDEVCPKFQDQWMVVTEDETFADSLKRELIRRNVEKDAVSDRFVVGIPWQHLSGLVKRLVEPTIEGECQLSTSTGAPCVLIDRVKGSFTDIEILSLNQCENTEIELDRYKMIKLEAEEETRFYRGG